MRELIRHILKENNLKQELKKVIEDDNIFKAADLVGGMDNLKSIFKDEPEMSSLFEKLTGKVTFYYPLGGEDDIEFPLDYEIIGRRSNVHNTNHWPEINVIYDENKLTPEENEVFKDMIKFLVDLGQHSGFKSKFNDGRIFNANYLTVLELNGEDINLIDEVISFEQEDSEYLHDKLYGDSESLNESTNSEIEKNLKAINVLLSLVSWDGLCDIWAEYNPDDKEYEIRSKTVTSNDLGPSIFEIQEELESLYNSIISMGIRVYIYTTWYVENCEDEVEFMNESSNESKSEDKKLNLVKEMIYSFFDEVEFIEVDTNYEGKPLIKIYHDVEDTAANYDNWLQHQIRDKIQEITGDGIILSPWWAPKWDIQKKLADFFIDVEKIEYDDEGNVINESDESKQERKFNKLIQNVEDYLNSNEYPSVKKFTVYYEDTHDDVIVNIFYNVEDSIRLGGGINSVIKRVGKQVMEDLEVFPMDFKYYIHFDRDINESEEKQPKYLDIIKDIVEPFKNEDCVCDIRVLYNEEDDMYLIDVEIGLFDLKEKFYGEVGRNHYVKKIRLDIKEAIKGYIPIDNFYVGSYSTPKCGEKRWWDKNINESDNKEQSLQKLVDQYGLYEFIKMTGLDFNQVKSILNKMDNPKEILKQYIREFVLEHDGMSGDNYGSLFALRLPLSNTKYVNDIMVQDRDQIAVEIWGYEEDEYGHTEQTEQYLTSINNLTNEELLSILSWMMEVIEEGYWD
jgi:hypothetical protein